MIIIPPDQLQPETLKALLEEFLTREGAVHGHEDVSTDAQITTLLGQIREGKASIVYDQESESWGVMAADQLKRADRVSRQKP